MILFCPKADEAALKEADTDLTLLSVKITSKNKKIRCKKICRWF
ncbi:MAG: hypothetical protein Ta2C_04100 [Candidatus Endomicrobiellum trichonymphae]|nr:hypothetical protein [Candidatus Endomicrobium trichonymphae]GMO53100.1 MAG: hypothetical protein Ta2C_04100 [Candidatus Endomicrobium trichonymphae]